MTEIDNQEYVGSNFTLPRTTLHFSDKEAASEGTYNFPKITDSSSAKAYVY